MNCAANPKQACAYRWALNEVWFLAGLEVSGYPSHRTKKKSRVC